MSISDSEINADFEKWACSLSGCDGGDPGAPVWLCGIEWGYGKSTSQTKEEYETALTLYYEKELPNEIKRGRYTPKPPYGWEHHLSYPFGKTAAKLIMAINKLPVEDYRKIETACQDLFRLNLYPIAFRYADDKLWDKRHMRRLTGLESKETYRTWCFLNRFPVMADLVKQHNPKMIIGTGVTYLTDFFVCFAGAGNAGNIHVDEVEPSSANNKSARRYYWSTINSGKTVLVVVPFFSGRYGLNSNFLLKELGSRLAPLYRAHPS